MEEGNTKMSVGDQCNETQKKKKTWSKEQWSCSTCSCVEGKKAEDKWHIEETGGENQMTNEDEKGKPNSLELAEKGEEEGTQEAQQMSWKRL